LNGKKGEFLRKREKASGIFQKKSGFSEFLHPPKNHENIEFLKWCTHEELNLKPADP
jgi:hypothetical protein